MKKEFKFDKKTGSLVAVQDSDIVETPIKSGETTNLSLVNTKESQSPSSQSSKTNVKPTEVISMKRVGKVTPIQLINEAGLPESYLDSANKGIMMFRDFEDYDVCQIIDEKTGKVLAYIGGYALQFSFNMNELNTLERIEQCLQGITKLFRHKIMNQSLGSAEKPS